MQGMDGYEPLTSSHDRAFAERWLGVVYESVYGCSPDDPRLRAMTATLGDPIVLGSALHVDAGARG